VKRRINPTLKPGHVVLLLLISPLWMGQNGPECDCDIVEVFSGATPDQIGDRGACCTDLMGCSDEVFRVDCSGENQDFFLNRTCGQIDCDTGFIARPCCFDDGTCELVFGDFNCDGTFLFGQSSCNDCGEGTTDVTEQACCLSNGECVVETEADCRARDGEPQGATIDCDEANCSESLSNEFGCCLSDGTTCQNQTMEDCMAAGGVPSTQLCDNIPDCGVFVDGPCCIGTNCQVRSKSTCDALGGTFEGGNEVCEGNTCS